MSSSLGNHIHGSLGGQLASLVGLHPSQDWLEACGKHLQQQKRQRVDLSSVLFEVLYSDLRDVVRHPTTTTSSAVSQQLAKAILASSQGNCASSLPESFQLLCQVEEAVDIAKSAEQQRGGSSCCKVCLSDGHGMILGTETVHIRGLSPESPAGTKVLLKGPLQIKHGILLLHPGNCILLGGCSWSLLGHQSRALAKKQEGIGIDPTIRALCNNHADLLHEEENDEAHEASGDVVSTAATAARVQDRHRGVPQQASSLYNVEQHAGSAGRKRNASQISNHSSTAAAAAAASGTDSSTTRSHHHQQQQSLRQIPPAASSTFTATSVQGSAVGRNPYRSTMKQQQQPYQTNSRQPRPADPPTSQIARITPVPNSVIRNHNNTNSSLRNSTNTINPYNKNNQRQQQQSKNPRDTTIRNSSTTSAPPASSPQKKRRIMANDNATNESSSPLHFLYSAPAKKSNVQNMSFGNLHRLLQQLVSNRGMYESYCQQEIIFNLVLSVPDHAQYDFNVVKIPKNSKTSGKSPKKPKKKYEYFTSARFASKDDSSVTIACQIHPDLLESCFEISANDLRALSRTDRPRCTAITNGGGEAVRNTYFAPRRWGATLHQSADQVFGGESSNGDALLQNLKKPILLLRNHHEAS